MEINGGEGVLLGLASPPRQQQGKEPKVPWKGEWLSGGPVGCCAS